MVCGQELRPVLLCYHMKAADHNSWPCSYHVNVCALRLPHASRRPQNGESGDVPPSGRGLVARPAAEGLHGRAEDTTLHPAAPTPPPSADSPMHSTRAQDAAEPCIADFYLLFEFYSTAFRGAAYKASRGMSWCKKNLIEHIHDF